MTAHDDPVAEACGQLAGLWPALAAALARDAGTGPDSSPAGWQLSVTVVNADVLAAILALDDEVPAAVRRACHVTGEPWRHRDIGGCLRQLPRLAGRMHDLGLVSEE